MGKVIPTLTNITYITQILPQKCPKTTYLSNIFLTEVNHRDVSASNNLSEARMSNQGILVMDLKTGDSGLMLT